MNRELLAWAHGFGVNACMKGHKRIPMFCSALAELTEGTKTKERIALLDAWLKGWDTTNRDPALAPWLEAVRAGRCGRCGLENCICEAFTPVATAEEVTA